MMLTCYSFIKEVRKIFEQLQKRTSKMQITHETVDSVRKISMDGFDNEELEKIQSLHKELLRYAMKNNDSNEVGMLVSLIDWKYIVVCGSENGISLGTVPKARELVCTAPKNSLLFLHNHPKNTAFSETDLESFLTADSILMVTVVCNNGRQFFLSKTAQFDKYKALVYYDEVYGITEEGSVKEFLRTCKKAGLDYNYGGN